MNPAAPTLQDIWDWRAAMNFIGGGTGTGLLLITAIAVVLGAPALASTLAGLAFVGAGLSMVWLEIGRPLRALHVFFNPRTSWMTREGAVAVPLMAFGLLAAWLQWTTLVVLVAVIAAGFLYCQGRILHASKGIPVWRTPRIVPLILATGLTEGTAMFLVLMPVLAPGAMTAAGIPVLLVLLILVAARYGAWLSYRHALKNNAPLEALEALKRAEPRLIILGTLLPIALGLGSLLAPAYGTLLAVASGAFAAFAGWFLKWVIIRRAAYNQGYALQHTPARGGGRPGPGTKPGW
jgi:phenylacetyl-CoA:acceptor oxidoreductase 26-kDa subunit